MKIYSRQRENNLFVGYVARPRGDVDQIIRTAFNLQGTPVQSIEEFRERGLVALMLSGEAKLDTSVVFTSSQEDPESLTVYYNPKSNLLKTGLLAYSYGREKVIVQISSTLPIATEELIQGAVIKLQLIPAGLVPIDSQREEVFP